MSLPIDRIFGPHPSLERAWLNNDPVVLNMRPASLPFKSGSHPKLRSRLLYAGQGNRGALSLESNRITVRQSTLKKTEFCIVGFPEFKTRNMSWLSLTTLSTSERKLLQSIASKLGDDATIHFQSSAHRAVLDSGDGWIIRLTRDEQQTRDSVGHTGLIERYDGSEYGIAELVTVLEELKYFFAFASGTYCDPTVAIGYDSRGTPVWGEIGQFTHIVHSVPNWFNNNDIRESTVLEDLFPRFWKKWIRHRDAIIAAMKCYVHSNAMLKAGIPEDAVASSYSGLEIIASLMLGHTIQNDSHKEVHKLLCTKLIPHHCLNQPEAPIMTKLCKDLNTGNRRGPYLLNTVRIMLPIHSTAKPMQKSRRST